MDENNLKNISGTPMTPPAGPPPEPTGWLACPGLAASWQERSLPTFSEKQTPILCATKRDELQERAVVAEKQLEAFILTDSAVASQAREKYPHFFRVTPKADPKKTEETGS
jgi:hypothetical protein